MSCTQAVWTCLAVARDGAINQRGIQRRQGWMVDTQPLGYSRPECLDRDVGPEDKALNDLPGLRLLQVQHDTALVTIRHAIHGLQNLARWVACGRLNFHDLRAQVGKG